MDKKLTGSRCKCTVCGGYFNSTGAFDKHRVGEYQHNGRRCWSEAEMEAKGMSKNETGFWIGSVMPVGRSYEGKTGEIGRKTYRDGG